MGPIGCIGPFVLFCLSICLVHQVFTCCGMSLELSFEMYALLNHQISMLFGYLNHGQLQIILLLNYLEERLFPFGVLKVSLYCSTCW